MRNREIAFYWKSLPGGRREGTKDRALAGLLAVDGAPDIAKHAGAAEAPAAVLHGTVDFPHPARAAPELMKTVT